MSTVNVHGLVELAAARPAAVVTAPSAEHIAAIKGIVVHGEDKYDEPNRIEIEFRSGRGGYDLAAAFAFWLSEITGKRATSWAPDA